MNSPIANNLKKRINALQSSDSAGEPLSGSSGRSGKLLLRAGLLLFVGSILLVLLGFVLKMMSLEGASEAIIAGFCLGLGGLLLLGCWLLVLLENPLK